MADWLLQDILIGIISAPIGQLSLRFVGKVWWLRPVWWQCGAWDLSDQYSA